MNFLRPRATQVCHSVGQELLFRKGLGRLERSGNWCSKKPEVNFRPGVGCREVGTGELRSWKGERKP